MRKKHFSQKEADQAARDYVARHPAWALICDIDDIEALYRQFDELRETEKLSWGSKDHYDEWATKACKVERAHVGGNREIYANLCEVPPNVSSMMIFKVGVKGKYRALVRKVEA